MSEIQKGISLSNRSTPEERELAKKQTELASLETQLGDKELELATLKTELSGFEQRYLNVVGARYAELDALRAQVALLKLRQNPNDSHAQKRAVEARAQAQESAQSTSPDDPETPSKSVKPSDEMKKLYREASKMMHPDLTTDANERARRTKAMAEVNQAYAAGDHARLEALIREFTSSPEAVQGEGPGAVLIRAIRKVAQVEDRLNVLEASLSELKATDLFKLYEKVEKAGLAGRDLLVEMTWEIVIEIATAREELSVLKGTKKV